MNTRWANSLVSAACLAVICMVGAARAEDDILPPEQAFPYDLSAEAGELLLRFDVPDGYYLYRERFGFDTEAADVVLEEAVFPKGKIYSDEFFGDMEIYRGSFTIQIPYTAAPSATAMELKLQLQGCADIGICYPPQKWSRSVNLPGANGAAAAFSEQFDKGVAAGTPLPPEQAFVLDVQPATANTLRVSFQIEPDYYLYKDQLAFEVVAGDIQLGQPQLEAGEPKNDAYYGTSEVYFQYTSATLPFSRRGPDAVPLTLLVTYQGCQDGGICYPIEQQQISLLLPASNEFQAIAASTGPVSEQDTLSRLILSGGLLVVMGKFFLIGLALAFTPCVLPMVPILSGIITGQGETVSTSKGFLLSLAYVLGMALTYTLAGALAALAGQQVQAMFQQPWILTLFAGLFVALALAMFGLYELQMPSAIQTRLTNVSNNQKAGSFIGAAVMGSLSALIVTACVTPALVAAAIVIGESGDVLRGALALFAMGIGMGAPLLVVGASAGKLLPKVGPWMVTVKAAFGVMMLGLAIWMLERVLPGTLILVLWAILVFVTGVFMGALEPLPVPASGAKRLGKSVGLLACLYGALMLIGATLGGHNPLRPIPQLALSGGQSQAQQHLAFEDIDTLTELDLALAQAKDQGQPVMVDFTADWCVSCKEMEEYTFSDAGVVNALSDYRLLRADVTANDDDDSALMQRFGIFGPPTIAFFDREGTEHKGLRLVGFVPADDFIDHVELADTL